VFNDRCSQEGKGDKFTFFVSSSHALQAHTYQREWIVDFGFSHHVAKDVSLFSCLSEAKEYKILVMDDFSFTIVGSGRVDCVNDVIINVYHVHYLSVSMLFVELTQTCKNIEF
jgi:hypothetical protein